MHLYPEAQDSCGFRAFSILGASGGKIPSKSATRGRRLDKLCCTFLVYNEIAYDISKAMEAQERDKLGAELPDGGKMFTLTENGVYRVVIYKSNTVLYAHSSEGSAEIPDILIELGYIKEK